MQAGQEHQIAKSEGAQTKVAGVDDEVGESAVDQAFARQQVGWPQLDLLAGPAQARKSQHQQCE
jgi:hypothetical protein